MSAADGHLTGRVAVVARLEIDQLAGGRDVLEFNLRRAAVGVGHDGEREPLVARGREAEIPPVVLVGGRAHGPASPGVIEQHPRHEARLDRPVVVAVLEAVVPVLTKQVVVPVVTVDHIAVVPAAAMQRVIVVAREAFESDRPHAGPGEGAGQFTLGRRQHHDQIRTPRADDGGVVALGAPDPQDAVGNREIDARRQDDRAFEPLDPDMCLNGTTKKRGPQAALHGWIPCERERASPGDLSPAGARESRKGCRRQASWPPMNGFLKPP